MGEELRSRDVSYLDDARRFVRYSFVEDVEIAGHRQGDEFIALCPCAPNLLVINTWTERPRCHQLARSHVPYIHRFRKKLPNC